MAAALSNPKVSVIILNWNGLEDTIECLESLSKADYPNYEVVVVDNASDGNDAQELTTKFGNFIKVIQNDKNYGCGEGFNIGIRYALAHSNPSYIMIMNNDIVVAPDFMSELVKTAETGEQIGIVGPKIYYYDYKGRKDVIWSAGGKIQRWALKIHRQIGENDNDLPRYQETTDMDWISGAVMLFKSQITEKVGLLNPWYFLGHEDIEFCLKARRHNYRIVYVPNSKVWHKVGASAKKAHITYADPSSYYYLIRHSFPLHIYIYHLLLLPVLIFRWGLLYILKNRDRKALYRFLSDFNRFLFKKRRRGI